MVDAGGGQINCSFLSNIPIDKAVLKKFVRRLTARSFDGLLKEKIFGATSGNFLNAITSIALAMVLSGCGESKSLDKFLGPAIGDSLTNTTSPVLEFDPASYDFKEVLTTAPGTLSKKVTVKNPATDTLFINSVTTNLSDHFQLVNNTCILLTAGIAGGTTCEFTVQFKPIAVGSFNFNVTFVYGLTATDTTKNSVFSAIGVGATPAVLTISGGPTYDFGSIPYGASATKSFLVTNTGSGSATAIAGSGLSSPFQYLGGTFPGTGGTCGTSLAPSASCTVIGEFAPTVAGPFTSTIQIDYFDTLANQQSLRPVTGTGLTPASLSINLGPTYDYGNVAIGGSKDQSFTVSNDGQYIASTLAGTALTAPFSYKGGTFPGTGGTCALTLNAAATCTVIITYSPTVTGTQTSTFRLNYNNGISAQSSTRAIQGSGATAATLSLSDGPTYDYGSIATGATRDKTFTLTNGGGVTATAISGGGLAAPYNFKGGTYPGTGGTCATTLAAATTCTMVVTYAPTAAGMTTDAIDVVYFDGVAAQTVSRAIQGNAVPPASLSISDGPTYSFGAIPVGGVTEKTFTVTNVGTTAATAITAGTLTAPFSFKGGFAPGTGGTCASSLAASATCTLVVRFAPVATGPFSDTLQLSYSDGVVTQSATRAIDGIGTPAGQLTIGDGPIYDFGSWPSGVVKDHTFTVTNSGGVSVGTMAGAGLAAPFSYKDGSYPGTGGTCATSLAPSATCTVIVSFAPSAVNTFNSNISITYNDGVSAQSSARAVTGVGVAPGSLLISDGPTYDFGMVATTATVNKTFTVTNTGGFPATTLAGDAISAPFAFKGGSYPGTGGTCATTLNTGSTCSVVVSYNPTTTGAHTGTIGITYNDGVGTQTSQRPVQGTGAAPALLSLSNGPTYDFGTVAIGASADKSFTLSNSGGVAASSVTGGGLTSPFSYKGGSFPGTGGTCGSSLAAGATCSVVGTYMPVAVGVQTGTASIGYNNGVSAQTATRDLTGTGVPPGSIFISDGPTYDFGTVAIGAVGQKSFTVTNNGSFSATAISGAVLSAPFAYNGGTYPGVSGTCGTSLAPAATCTIVVTFTPTTSGSFNGSVDISFYDGTATQTSSRPVQGTGATAASLTISDGPTYDFGTKASGSSTDKTFNVTNSGGVTGTTMSGSSLVAPFSFKGGSYPGTGATCGASLAAGATCTIIVTYAPTGTGANSSTINVSYNDGVAGQAATRGVTGFGATPALLTLSNGPSYDFGTIAAGGFLDKSFTVTNTGGVISTSMSGGGLAAPYGFKGGSYPGTGGTCAATLAAAANCTIVVTFAPTIGGSSMDTIEISYNDGVAVQLATRDVSGNSLAPGQLTISDAPSYDFGAVPTTGSADKVLTVTNTGSVASTSIAGSGLTAPFTFKGGSYPGTGGTCGASLNSAASCTVIVRFSPTANGAFSQSMTLTFNDGAATQTSVRIVQGTGAPPASITISDGATYNFGNLANGSTGEKTFTLTNGGGVTATALAGGAFSAPYSFKGGLYPGTGGSCSTTLTSTASCTVVVIYSPTSLGTQTATLSVDYNDGLVAQTATRALTGTSVAPASLAFSDGPTFDYGVAATGATVDKSFTITNSGAFSASSMAGAAVAAPYSFKGGTFPGTGGTCSATLAASATCLVVVSWMPTSTGVQTGSVQLNYFDGAQNQSTTRPLTGTGAAPALIAISDGPTYDFGTKASGSSTDKTFTLSNTGGVNSTAMSGGGLAAPFTFKGGSYPGTGGTCASTLAASATCNVVVTFAPTVGGVMTDTMDISYNNGAALATSSRDVTGTGSAPAILTISDGATYDFGAVVLTGTKDKVFTVTNTGNLGASTIAGTAFSAPYTFKGGTFPGTGGTCGTTLAPAATCLVAVTFSPTVLGTYNASLTLTYDDGVSSVSSARPIQGLGASPASITISDGATYNFGNLANGSTADKTFTLTNGGGVGATAMAGQALVAPYSYKGGIYPGTGGTCSTTMAAAATCTVVVSYSPTALGTQTATLSVDYNNGLSGQTASRAMTGTSVAPALLAFSDGPTYDFGTLATGATLDKTLTITNTGSFTASSMTGGGFVAPFTYNGGSYPGTGGNCSTTLAAGGTCVVVVRWAPVATGLQTATGTLDYYDGALNQQASRPVQGVGAAPALLTISDGPTYDFGTQATGSVTEKSFTVTNSGGVASSLMGGSGLAAPFAFKGGSYPGTGATCGASLAASATCTVIATFSPTVAGVQSASLDIGYNNGVSVQTTSRAVTGTGNAPAILTISDGATYDFGAVAVTGSADKIFTVTNSGNLTGTTIVGSGLSGNFSYKGGSFPGTGGTCGATLAPAATCTIAATFSPATAGSFNSSIILNFNDGASAQSSTRPVQGVGATPASITISDGATYSFGNVANGAAVDKSFTLTNGGGVTATAVAGAALSPPYSYKGGTYPGTAGTCAATLNAAATCTVVVTYSPTSLGTDASTLTINYTNGLTGTSATRPMTGTSVAPALLTFSDGPTYDFGSLAVGATLDKTFTITNSGAVTATTMGSAGLAAPYSFKAGAYPGTGGTCGTTLAASSACTVVVTWTPTVTGVQASSVIVSYFDGAQLQSATRAVTGTGTAAGLIAISDGPTYDFGSQATGSSTDKTFILTNTGGGSSTSISGGGLSAPFSYKGGSYPGTGGTCSTTLASSATCNVVVTFAPSTSGSFSSSINISYNNGVSVQSSTRAVQGNGLGPAVFTISDGATYDFGPVATTGSADKVFTLTNSGGLSGSSLMATALSAPYAFKGGTFPGTGGTCGATLAASASCTFVVRFSPTANGSTSETISLSYNDQAQTQSATRGIQGTGAAPASITISDGATYSFGTIANGGVAEKSFTLTNGGGVGATVMSGATLSAPYSFKGGTYPGTGGSCAATLGVAATCTVVVVYSPTSIATDNSSVGVNYFDGLATQLASRALTGSAVAPASLSLSDGPTYNFGTLATGSTLDKTLTVTNSGSFTASAMSGSGLVAPFTFKGGTYPGTGGTCAATLSVAATCTVVVTYAPTASGTQNGTANVIYNDGANAQTASRPLTGVGVAPSLLTISDGPTYDYGSVANGSVNDKSFTVTNSGGLTATSVSGGGLSAPFTFKGGSYPGAGGTCGASIAAAATCTVVVSYSPTVTGSVSSSIDLTFNTGVATATSSRAVTGTSTAPAVLAISDGATYNYGNVANGSVNDKSFTVTNTGGFTASTISGSGLSAPFTFKAGSFPGAGGTCSLTLAAGGSCTVVVTYSPVSSASSNGTFNIGYNDGVSAQTSSRPVQGISTAPAVLTISDATTYDFGSVAVTASGEKTFTVTNSGNFTASSMSGTGLTAPFTFKGGTYPGTAGTCAASLGASSTCTVVVTYAPTATGLQTSTLSVAYNDGAGAQTANRPVQGTGVAPALITISNGPTYDYGSRATGGSTDNTFTLTNTGGLTATSISGGGLSAPFSFKGASYPGTGGTCGTSLAAAGTCTVVVTYAPTVNGAASSSLDISFNNGVSAQTSSRPVTGTGVSPAILTVSDAVTYDYGPVATTGVAEKVFTLTNSGGIVATSIAPVALAAPYAFKGGSFPGTGGTCGATLAVSATCTFNVTFSPTANGSASTTVTLNYNDGVAAQSATRPVQGTGSPPASITISDGATYSFGSIANGGSAEKTFTLTNGGGVTATALAGGTIAAPYGFKGGTYPGTAGTCAASLGVSGTCTIVVVFNPTSIGTLTGTASVNYNNGLSVVSATRPLTGVATAPALLTINNGPTYDFGTLATGSTIDATFTVTNSGNTLATTLAGAGLAAPFTFKGASFPGTGGTCGTTLAVSASCTVVVTWAPTASGAQSSTLQVTYFDGAVAQTASRAVTGTGVAPALLTISDGPTYDYGAVANTSVNNKTFTVTNSGGLGATAISGGALSAPFSFSGGSYPGTGGTCGTSLSAAASCLIVVRYNPMTTNSYSATVSLGYNDGVTAQSATRPVIGTSNAPAVLTISDAATYSFGTQPNGSSTDKTFTITNSGGVTGTSVAPTALTAPYSFKGGTYPGAGGTCGVTLASSGTCTVVVTFAPTVSATSNQTLTMNYNDGVQALTATRPMTGISIAPALLTISGSGTYNFGSLVTTTTADATFTVTNSGAVTATSVAPTALVAPFSFKGGTYPGTGGTCGATLVGGNTTCTIVVTYAPTTTGIHTDTITMNYNNGVGAVTATRPVQGTGVAPSSITISSGPTYDYGTVAVGSSWDKSFNVTNNGGYTASAMTGSGLAAPFTFKGGSYPGTGGNCGVSLAGGGTSCTIVVTYAPTNSASHSSTVNIGYNDGLTTQSATRAVIGVGSTSALLSISDGVTYDYGNVGNSATLDKSFTVTNSGGVSATSMSGSGLSAPINFKGGTYPGTGGNCSASLAAAATCTVVVTFAPTATNTYNRTLTINYNDGLAAQTATRGLTGTSYAAAILSYSPTGTYDFGSIEFGMVSNLTITVSNVGTIAATSMTSIAFTEPSITYTGGTYPGTGGTCATTLAASSSCTLKISFAPTTAGVKTDSAKVDFYDGLVTQHLVAPLQGVGTTALPPTLTRTSPASAYANTNSATILASGLFVGDSVRIYSDAACSAQIASGTVATGTTLSFTFSPITVDGTYNYYANRTNSAGTASVCSPTPATFTRDTVAPVMTSLDLVTPATSPGYESTPVLRATGTFNGDNVSIYSNAGCTTLVTTGTGYSGATADVTLPTIGSAGSYNYYAKAVDLAGNVSACTSSAVNYVFDATDVTVEFSTAYQYVTEGGGTVTATVSTSASKAFPVVVSYKTFGTAISGTHTSGIASTGTVTIPASQTSATITFTVPQNATVEKDKYLDIALLDTDWPYSHVAGRVSHRVMILDDDQTATAPIALPRSQGAGQNVACYINSASKLFCMGSGGLVGDGTGVDRPTYVAVDAGNNFASVSVGTSHVCAVTAAGGSDATGTIRCWGANTNNQLGDNTTTARTAPVSITTNIGTGVLAVSAGTGHTCAISSTSKLYCWGDNNLQQVTGLAGANKSTPFALDAATNYTAVAAGDAHTCAIQTVSNVMTCFGENTDGKTGVGTTAGFAAVGSVVNAGTAYSEISVGPRQSCARTTGNALHCWGSNSGGRIGLGGTSNVTSATVVDSGVSYSKISVGLENLCGITAAGALRCTGRVDLGVLLDRLTTDKTAMATVQSGTSFADVSLGYQSIWARTTTNRVLFGGVSELFAFGGDGKAAVNATTAVTFDGTRTFTSVDRGGGADRSTCAIASGQLRCVGSSNTAGFLGLNSAPDVTGYVWVDANNTYSMVATGRYHMCAIRANGKLFCSGDANYNGANTTTSAMVAVDGGNNYSVIAAGRETTCGILTNGELKCWGTNNRSQVGNNSTSRVLTPTTIDSGVSYSTVAVGTEHACGITTAGDLKCWGYRANGRQGDGSTSTTNIGTPTTRDSGVTYAQIAAGDAHTCGITTANKIKCWGLNSDGRLGDGSTTQRTTPTAVDSSNNYSKISIGWTNSCAVRTSGDLYCWGSYLEGVAGTGATNATSPAIVDSGTSYSNVHLGAYRACGLTTTGTVRCWGNNSFNTYGDATHMTLPQGLPMTGYTQN